MRTIDWVDGAVEIIDQTVLPGELRILRLHTVPELVAAIQSLAVRGAPALGVAGAFGVALAARVHADDPAALAVAVRKIENARPTAVNLAREARHPPPPGRERGAGRPPGGGPAAARATGRAGPGLRHPRRGDRRVGGHGRPRRRPDARALRRPAPAAHPLQHRRAGRGGARHGPGCRARVARA